MNIIRFFKNLSYLFKVDLKQMYKMQKSLNLETFDYILGSYKYEVFYDMQHGLRLPKILSYEDTVEKLIKEDLSIARFGDGDFRTILGEDVAHQEADEKLSQRLKEVLISKDDKIAIGLSMCCFASTEALMSTTKNYTRKWVGKYREQIEGLIDWDKQYFSAEFTQLYMILKDYDFSKYFSRIADIWRGKDITIICGKTVFDKIENNIFDCARSVEYVYGPSKNAFREYDKLLSDAMQIDKKRMVIIILGPTATVLAYDLAKNGYRALDFGHIAKDYDSFVKKIEKSDKNVQGFFKPD